jgi:hypothetical protein
MQAVHENLMMPLQNPRNKYGVPVEVNNLYPVGRLAHRLGEPGFFNIQNPRIGIVVLPDGRLKQSCEIEFYDDTVIGHALKDNCKKVLLRPCPFKENGRCNPTLSECIPR